MNVYVQLNKVSQYIEEHLDEEINFKYLSKMLGCSEYTFNRLFSFLTGYSVREYIRNRKLTIAAMDLIEGMRVIDVAIKYGYSSPISFSRAFKQLYGINPKEIKKNNVSLKLQPILSFYAPDLKKDLITYRIEYKSQFTLYGKFVQMPKEENIPPYAEKLWKKTCKDDFFSSFKVRYGVIETHEEQKNYWCCVSKKNHDYNQIVIPDSKYLVITGNIIEGEEIKKVMQQSCSTYIPSIHKSADNNYVIEVYYPDYLEIWIPIY